MLKIETQYVDLSKVTPQRVIPASVPPYPYNADQRAWLNDLLYTKAPQAMGKLFACGNGDEFGFCCLGRALAVMQAHGTYDPTKGRVDFEAGHTSDLPDKYRRRLRLRSNLGQLAKPVLIVPLGKEFPKYAELTTLAHMNDSGLGLTFKCIAEYIEADPWNVFLEPDDEDAQPLPEFELVAGYTANAALQAPQEPSVSVDTTKKEPCPCGDPQCGMNPYEGN